MSFLGFGHALENRFSFFVRLARGEIAIGLRGINLGAPIALHDLDGLGFARFGIHLAHPVSIAAVMGGIGLESCCTVMMSATEPMINIAARSVRSVTVSCANNAPSNTATIGFT